MQAHDTQGSRLRHARAEKKSTPLALARRVAGVLPQKDSVCRGSRYRAPVTSDPPADSPPRRAPGSAKPLVGRLGAKIGLFYFFGLDHGERPARLRAHGGSTSGNCPRGSRTLVSPWGRCCCSSCPASLGQPSWPAGRSRSCSTHQASCSACRRCSWLSPRSSGSRCGPIAGLACGLLRRPSARSPSPWSCSSCGTASPPAAPRDLPHRSGGALPLQQQRARRADLGVADQIRAARERRVLEAGPRRMPPRLRPIRRPSTPPGSVSRCWRTDNGSPARCMTSSRTACR